MKSPANLIGHRGWPARFPDNTLAGFLAVLPHVDGVELDVRRSADGKLVLSHGLDLAGHEVASTPWSVLAEVDLGNGHRPALLDEILSSLPGTPVQIEVKNEPLHQGFEPDHRLALEAASRARDGDVVTSFNWASVAAVRDAFPDVATGVIIGRYQDLDGAVEHCLEMGHELVVPDHHLIGQPVLEFSRGLAVNAWTVNDPGRAEELAGLGVSGIITDDPLAIASIRSQT